MTASRPSVSACALAALAALAVVVALAQPAVGQIAPERIGTIESSEGTMQQTVSDIELIETMLNGDGWGEEMFAPGFLERVPVGDIETLIDQLRAVLGGPVTVSGAAGRYEATSATHAMGVQLARDDQGRIAGLFFSAPDETARTLEDILAELEALAPDTAWLITRDEEPLHARNADAALAVGSAFKLGVLKALQDAIAEGRMGWNDVYMLDEQHRSLPTGILQSYPQDSPLTVHTLAALMISQSDNTATDFLMRIVGRSAVRDALGGAWPLTTRELFVLKAQADLRADYLALEPDDADGRDAVMARVAEAPLPSVTEILSPHIEGIEWYLPLETLCALASDVANNDVFAINPGPVRAADWRSVAYKGGSEIGVLNLTAHMVAPTGEAWCAAVTLNGSDTLDENAAIALYGALATRVAALAREDAEAGEDEAEDETEAGETVTSEAGPGGA